MISFRKISRLAAALLVAAIIAVGTTARACPGCAEAQAGQGSNRSDVVKGYQYSILFMMSMPFLLVGSFGGYVYWSVRKARREQASATLAPPSAADPSNDQPTPA